MGGVVNQQFLEYTWCNSTSLIITSTTYSKLNLFKKLIKV